MIETPSAATNLAEIQAHYLRALALADLTGQLTERNVYRRKE